MNSGFIPAEDFGSRDLQNGEYFFSFREKCFGIGRRLHFNSLKETVHF
jgi:hypothetical protein